MDPGSEVADSDKGVFRESALCKSQRVQPLERGVLDGTVVEIESVDVEDRPHGLVRGWDWTP